MDEYRNSTQPLGVVLVKGANDSSRRNSTWRAFRRRRLAFAGTSILFVIVVLAILDPVLPLHDPNLVNLNIPLRGPSWSHLLGTDQLGRDEFSRILSATRISLWAALQATVVGFFVGVPLGLSMGLRGGRIDSFVSRSFDSLQSIPPLILAIAIIAALGRELTPAMIAVGLVFSPTFYRVARASASTIANESYVEASRSMGQRTWKVVATHVVGNVSGPLIAQTSTAFAFGILAEAALSYLGLGVQPPEASLGSMLASSADLLNSSPQLTILPGLVIMFIVLCVSLSAGAIRDLTSGHENS
jgi:ABC-type dipeptide/oligopeptide/nickel transport system permease subunit